MKTDPYPELERAMRHLEHQEDTQAEQILASVLARHPDHPQAHLFMAMALAKTAPERALSHTERALQDTDPERRRQAEALRRVLQEDVSV